MKKKYNHPTKSLKIILLLFLLTGSVSCGLFDTNNACDCDDPTPDTVKPTVTSTTPSEETTGVIPNQSVTVTFSEAMDAATLTENTFILLENNCSTEVSGSVTYNSTSHTATFTPTEGLKSDTQYTARIKTDVKDANGNAMAKKKEWQFATSDFLFPPVCLPTD